MKRLAAVLGMGVLAVAGCSTGSGDGSDLHLAFGQSTRVTAADGAAELTVTGLSRADHADFDELQNPAEFTDKTGYYLRYTITRVEGPQPSHVDKFRVGAGSDFLTELTVDNGFAQCQPASAGELQGAAVGDQVSGCQIFVADAGVGQPTDVIWAPYNRASPVVIWSP